ncbi:TGS domain-containing protein [candidate division WOR-3 bacterium]|uniref:TGS domain-containing protein n=1 Tax=candidate division WOR-3 bacterium TaxID=2052148 RepID=A0A9D5K9L0_UNCW3|nr:TGS domain-containing protein [candidate division WOR-3 bacterium]MBD3365013.1 TGS domain-containing protein [candidate division WOR-3 bacterium]
MPANLTPQYREAEQRYREAITNEEKFAALKEMFALIPKHKGTEKMQADIKKKLSRLEKEMRNKPKTATSRRERMYNIPKQGAGQIGLLGAANSGKSSLFFALTGADSVIASWPYSTPHPVVGMIIYENIQLQLIDMPPMISEHTEPWQWGILRNADVVMAVFTADKEPEKQINAINKKIRQYHLGNVLWVATKIDRLPDGSMPRFPVEARFTSPQQLVGLEELSRAAFDALNIVRVYTKQPGKEADMNDPVILKKGSVLMDAAYHLHKDFAENLKYARLWNREADGIRVARDYVMQDGDIVEFHIR